MAELDWGRRYLMCPPRHFGVLYEINPWMHREVAVDPDAATTQWQALVGALRGAGAVLSPDPPDRPGDHPSGPPDPPDLATAAP